MPFVSYGTVEDGKIMAASAMADLYLGDQDLFLGHLKHTARMINEKLRAMDTIDSDDVPVPVDDDGKYPMVLIMWNVYEAVWMRVLDIYGGEAIDTQWRWLRSEANRIATEIQAGKYGFGPDADEVGGPAPPVELQRRSI